MDHGFNNKGKGPDSKPPFNSTLRIIRFFKSQK